MFQITTLLGAALLLTQSALAQLLLMPDSGANNRLVAFNPVDGTTINSNVFPLQGGTAISAIEVNGEVWVSEQTGDRVVRYDFQTGATLGVIGPTFPAGGLDNIRGLSYINGLVYVTNAGTQNGSFGAAVVVFDPAGNYVFHFATTTTAPSPFSVLSFQGDILVASSSPADDVHRFTLTGGSVGTFHDSTSLNFAHQLALASDGNVWCAGFSSNNVVKLDATTGAILQSFPASGARGVFELSNGNVMWTNGSGAHIFDLATQTSSLSYAGVGRHLNLYGAGQAASAIQYGNGCGAASQSPLLLASIGRPILGSSPSLQTTNIPANAQFGYLAFGFLRFTPPIDLTSIGMPGCTQSIAPAAEQFFLPAGATFAQPFAVPANPSFTGLQLQVQTLVFAPGVNPLGAITSNGLELLFGSF